MAMLIRSNDTGEFFTYSSGVTSINNMEGNVTLTPANLGAVPASRKVNGQALTHDISIEVPRPIALSVSIGVNDWTSVNGAFTYTVNNSAITTQHFPLLQGIDETALKADLQMNTSNGSIQFTTNVKPTAALNGVLLLVEVIA